ncbi:PEP-CTERM sorting domain-containing protein [Tautonia sp. JC769]|uniref:PEP-CTERM sorting domain-containing protein n=1 Tax=Tautonia sp. JC769 TaxID=3232135 RepID=UPI003458D09F
MPLLFTTPRVLLGLLGLIVLSSAPPAQAESLRSRLTRKDDMNAIRFQGQDWTIHDLIDRRSQAPGRFDVHHQRLGSALGLGLEGLEARRALNPRRFDFFHPFLGYLLSDIDPDSGLGAGGDPVIDDPPIGQDGGPQPLPDESVSPQVPEPPQPPIVPPTPTDPTVPPPLDQLPSVPDESEGPQLPGAPDGPEVTPPTVDPIGTDDPNEIRAIPEPSTVIQLSVGLAGLVGALAWRRRAVPRPAAD